MAKRSATATAGATRRPSTKNDASAKGDSKSPAGGSSPGRRPGSPLDRIKAFLGTRRGKVIAGAGAAGAVVLLALRARKGGSAGAVEEAAEAFAPSLEAGETPYDGAAGVGYDPGAVDALLDATTDLVDRLAGSGFTIDDSLNPDPTFADDGGGFASPPQTSTSFLGGSVAQPKSLGSVSGASLAPTATATKTKTAGAGYAAKLGRVVAKPGPAPPKKPTVSTGPASSKPFKPSPKPPPPPPYKPPPPKPPPPPPKPPPPPPPKPKPPPPPPPKPKPKPPPPPPPKPKPKPPPPPPKKKKK